MMLALTVAIGTTSCRRAATSAPEWEYKLMMRGAVGSYGIPKGELVPAAGWNERIRACFRDLGAEGWEYVGELSTEEVTSQVFKRPVAMD